MKKWTIGKPDSDISSKIISGSDISPLCADVLVSRNIKSLDEAAEFLRKSDEPESPFTLKDMDKAVAVINKAIDSGEKICVYSDYDCDGVTGLVMLFVYLEFCGADVSWYIPEREEGYGLNEKAIRQLAEEGTNLIITVDNGISAVSEAELIYSLGMRLLITDHHQPGEVLPVAEGIVNPHQKDCGSSFKPLCGAGVVLKLISALDGGDYYMAFEQFGDLAAIGTIGDVVSITGENRYIVQKGMEYLKNTERIGLVELMKALKIINEDGEIKSLNSLDIAFRIVPCINAAGRIDTPSKAVKLLLSEDCDEAAALAAEICGINESRKEQCENILNKIYDQINSSPDCLADRVLVFAGENWHHGIIGIVASKIVETYDKPCIIITNEGEYSRGSARSFGDFSIFECLTYCSSVLTKFGGHKGAGGFSLKTEDTDKFKKLIAEYTLKNHPEMPVMELHAEKSLLPADITVENAEGMDILEPFGEENAKPLFAMTHALVTDVVALKGGIHTKLRINYGGKLCNALMFGVRTDQLGIKSGDVCDFMVTLNVNEYNGSKSVSLMVADYRKSGLNQNSIIAAINTYDKYVRGEELSSAYYKKIYPERDDLVQVYKSILKFASSVNIFTLFSSLDTEKINYCKLKICIDVFNELNLIKVDYASCEVSAIKPAQKAELENSEILKELKRKWEMKAAQ